MPRGSSLPEPVYQIKVTLLGSRPPIWRRLLVPSGMTLARLHLTIQLAMPWSDSHLHEFMVGRERFGSPDPFGEAINDDPDQRNESTTLLSEVLTRKGSKARYVYDFGDDWIHEIVVEKILPPDPEVAGPVCTAGKMSCPPEDCGGLGGYYGLLEAIGDPEHERYEELTDWLGEPFDPEAFSVEETNERLANLRGKSRRKRS